MSSYIADAAASVLPVSASAAAIAAAFVAFTNRREVAAAVRPHDADLMPTTGWFGDSVKRIASGTSYDPQSRGSSG
jgi:hypothetical protein